MKLRRVLEPIILGSLANIVINYIFDPYSPDFFLKEFIVAICLCIPVTELNHQVNNKLEQIVSWSDRPLRRFFIHLSALLLIVILIIDLVGNLYMWLEYDSFYTWGELLMINIVILVMSLILTSIRWTTDFYFRWKQAESKFNDSSRKLDILKIEIDKAVDTIQLRRGQGLFNIIIHDMRLAKIEMGAVLVFINNDENAWYDGSLTKLFELLPRHLFFTTRNAIIHRDAILGVSSSSFGKVDVKIKPIIDEVTIIVSRPKAASFRSWYDSNS